MNDNTAKLTKLVPTQRSGGDSGGKCLRGVNETDGAERGGVGGMYGRGNVDDRRRRADRRQFKHACMHMNQA